MAFKNNRQRRAVMAKLRCTSITPNHAIIEGKNAAVSMDRVVDGNIIRVFSKGKRVLWITVDKKGGIKTRQVSKITSRAVARVFK